MKTSEAFRRTKKFVFLGSTNKLYGKNQFICCAAGEAGVRATVEPIIEKLMNPDGRKINCSTFEAWLQKRHNIDTASDPRKIQRTRHAWLDHLIAHYEALND